MYRILLSLLLLIHFMHWLDVHKMFCYWYIVLELMISLHINYYVSDRNRPELTSKWFVAGNLAIILVMHILSKFMRRIVYIQVVNALIGKELSVEWRGGEEFEAVKFLTFKLWSIIHTRNTYFQYLIHDFINFCNVSDM